MSMISALRDYAGDMGGVSAPVADRWNSAAPVVKIGDTIVTLYSDVSQLSDEWQAFETSANGCLFQSYRWIYAWARTAAAAHGEDVVVAVGRTEDGRTLFILPFAIESMMGTDLLTWCGHSQANYNVPFMAEDFAQSVDASTLRELLIAVAKSVPGVSAIYLESQPQKWAGMDNPFQQLPHFVSANSCYAVKLCDDFHSLMANHMGKNAKRSLRRKENKLRAFGEFVLEPAQGMYGRLDVLDQFYAQKSAQFRDAGIVDIFADPTIRAFYRDLVAGNDDDDDSFELYTLRINGDLVATFNGLAYQNRFYLLLSSLTQAEYRRWSPGLLVMKAHLQRCCERGLDAYDLGAGASDHKAIWTNETVGMFDTFLPVSAAGHVYAKAFAAKTSAKRVIKNNPTLWKMAKQIRQKVGALRG